MVRNLFLMFFAMSVANLAYGQFKELDKSHFFSILKERKEQIYVFGENHIDNLPEIQMELIRFLHFHKGVRIIAYEAPLIFEDILNDYVLERKDKLFLLKDAFFSYKSFKIYIDSIKAFNIKLPSSDRLEFKCFESSGLNDNRFINLLNNQYYSRLLSDSSDLLPFLKGRNPQKITKNYLDTMLSITIRESMTNTKNIYLKIEKLIRAQLKSNQINSLSMIEWSITRENELYNNIMNIKKQYSNFIITTGLYHANKKLNNDKSFTSRMIYEDKIDAFIASFSNQGVLRHSMYYGGNCYDLITDLDSDMAGNIYAVGKAAFNPNMTCNGSSNLPIVGNGFTFASTGAQNPNHFLIKMEKFVNNSPINILHASYFGGGGAEMSENSNFGISWAETVLSVRGDGVVAIAGATNSSSNNAPKIQMPTIQPNNYFVQADKNLVANLTEDAYIAIFDADFVLKYSTYFGGGLFGDAASGLSFSETDKRLYFCGNTSTLNGINAINPNEILFIEQYSEISVTDFILDVPIANSNPTWLAFLTTADFTATGVSLDEIFNNSKTISLYPNPTTNKVNIKSETRINKIEVYDLQGRLLFENNPFLNNFTLDFVDFQFGQYVIKLMTDHETFTSKIQKI